MVWGDLDRPTDLQSLDAVRFSAKAGVRPQPEIAPGRQVSRHAFEDRHGLDRLGRPLGTRWRQDGRPSRCGRRGGSLGRRVGLVSPTAARGVGTVALELECGHSSEARH